MPAADRHWARPADPCGTGVLVLAGSSGRVDAARADLLASHGATALAVRWFGGPGQPAVAREVPLETFTAALDELAAESDRLAIVGLSYGAEAALLTASRDPRVTATVAVAPTDVAWEGARDSDQDPVRSKWTWRGEPLPFVPLAVDWTPQEPTPWFRPFYEVSRAGTSREVVDAATIAVEDIGGELVLVAGGDDLVWPSDAAARRIAERRRARGLVATVVADERAGHPVVLPGEPTGEQTRPYLVGGDAGAAERLGRAAWPEIRRVLRLR